MSTKSVDWDSIEVHFRAGARSLRDIGAEYGVSEGAIRKAAKKHGWTRNPAALERERVNARLQCTQSTQLTPTVDERVQAQIDTEVEADVEDMNTALRM